jgi:hypothetical protein
VKGEWRVALRQHQDCRDTTYAQDPEVDGLQSAISSRLLCAHIGRSANTMRSSEADIAI